VATGERERLNVFGGDYATTDGTGVRDFIHVMDLAEGHKAALEYCLSKSETLLTTNLGTGQGYSVLEILRTYEQVSGRAIPYTITERRPGDVAACWADTHHAERILNWTAKRSLQNICADGWRWAQR